MTEPSGDVRVLVELIAKSLVDAPDDVFVEKFDDYVSDVASLVAIVKARSDGADQVVCRAGDSGPRSGHDAG